MKKFSYGLLVFSILATGLYSYAATITVSKNPGDGANFSTINDAITAANDGDVIRILDSSLYQEDFIYPAAAANASGHAAKDLSNLTIEAAAGQTPTLEKNAGTGQVFRYAPSVAGVFTIRGAAPETRITLRNTATTTPITNTGPVTTAEHAWHLENVILERPTTGTGSTGTVLNFNNEGDHVIINVAMRGRDVTDGSWLYVMGVGANGSITCTNLDTRCNGAGGGLALTSHGSGLSGPLTFNNCIFEPDATVPPPGLAFLRISTATPWNGVATFNNCQFAVCKATSGVVHRLFDITGDGRGNGSTFIFENPTFSGLSGDIGFNASGNSVNLTIRGTNPASKVDLGPFATGGAVLTARTSGGNWTFENCTDTSGVGCPSGLLDCAAGVPLISDVNVVMNQCNWPTGRTGDFIAADTGGAFATNFTATNCIWSGTTPAGHIIGMNGSHTGLSTMTLTHCTFWKRTGNAFFFGNAGDLVKMDGCIVYTDTITQSHALSSIAVSHGTANIPNLTYVNDPDDGGGVAYIGDAFLGGEIVANPLLDSQGRLTAGSPALGAALGSTITVDFEGDARPLGNTSPDIGGDESSLMGVVDPNLVKNGSFEANPRSDTWPYYGPVNQWTGASGLNRGDGPFWDNATGIENINGTQVMFKQGGGAVSQTVLGFATGQNYTLRFRENRRTTDAAAVVNCEVRLNGSVLVANHVVAVGQWTPYQHNFASPGDGGFLLEFVVNVTNGDGTYLLDCVSIVPQGEADPFPLNPLPPPTGWPIKVKKIAGTVPTINGILGVGEWDGANVVDLRLSTLTIPDPFTPSVTHAGTYLPVNGTITNDADASGLYYILYSDSGLYIAADVTDENLSPSSGVTPNAGDAFQICLDYDQTNAPDAQAAGSKVYIPTYRAIAGSGTAPVPATGDFHAFWPTSSPNPMTGTQWATTTHAAGFRTETFIPWTAFTAGGDTFTNPFPPAAGQTCGTLVMIDDHDGGAGQGISFMYTAGGGANIIVNAGAYNDLIFEAPLTIDDWTQY